VGRDDDAAGEERDDQQEVRKGEDAARLEQCHALSFVKKMSGTRSLRHRLAHRLAEGGDSSAGGHIQRAMDAVAATPRKLRATKAILPVMDPRFNLREAAKQLLLLEDHLAQPRRRCPDCIRKHFATAEAFCEEAITLDTEQHCTALCVQLQEKLRELQAELDRGATTPDGAAAQLRTIRKPLLACANEWLLREKYRPAGGTPSKGHEREA